MKLRMFASWGKIVATIKCVLTIILYGLLTKIIVMITLLIINAKNKTARRNMLYGNL